MPNSVLDRKAPSDHAILLGDRWSPRAFDPSTPIDEELLSAALEAARWSPSASNIQPWRFVVARRGTALHTALHETLTGYNAVWAGNAAVLIATLAETTTAEGEPNRFALYDLGQAVAHLTVQAHHDGLVLHQMGGFDGDQVLSIAGLDDRFTPLSIVAMGALGELSSLPEPLQQREVAPRVRRPLSETVLLND